MRYDVYLTTSQIFLKKNNLVKFKPKANVIIVFFFVFILKVIEVNNLLIEVERIKKYCWFKILIPNRRISLNLHLVD